MTRLDSPPGRPDRPVSAGDAVVTASGISKYYRDFMAVGDLDLEVAEGEILGIIGHNGAGKTTILKMLTGLVAPTAGTIEIMGLDIARHGSRVKNYLGYLPEESPFYENMTVVEYLMFFSALYRMPADLARRRIEELLFTLKLSTDGKLTGELSKGMKRKAAIARTLLHDPRLLILDEPNSGLDPLTSFFIIDYLRDLKKQGKTIILSAHNLFHIEYICDRVAILKDGRLILCDSMTAIRQTLGERQYEVTFQANEALDFERSGDNYVFRSADVGEMAGVLRQVSDRGWELVDLAIRQSALEEIYVRLMRPAPSAPADW